MAAFNRMYNLATDPAARKRFQEGRQWDRAAAQGGGVNRIGAAMDRARGTAAANVAAASPAAPEPATPEVTPGDKWADAHASLEQGRQGALGQVSGLQSQMARRAAQMNALRGGSGAGGSAQAGAAQAALGGMNLASNIEQRYGGLASQLHAAEAGQLPELDRLEFDKMMYETDQDFQKKLADQMAQGGGGSSAWGGIKQGVGDAWDWATGWMG